MAFNFYVRGLLITAWFFICCILVTLISLVRFRNPTNGYIFAQLFTQVGRRLAGVKIIIHNPERLIENQPCVYIGNHQSNADILIQGSAYSPRTVMTGKKELIYIPLFGTLFYLAGNVMLNRKNKKTSLESMAKLEAFVKKERLSVYMFPEGTRNHGTSELLPFKRGAFHLAVGTQFPLVPIVCSPIYPVIDLHKHIIRKGVIHIQVMEPISTVGKTDQDIDHLLESTREKMQQQFRQLQTEVR